MIIKMLDVDNWMAYRGETTIRGLPALPIAVVAKYADDPRRSNWAGKTALLEAIRWALTGKHRKRIDDAVIHYGAKECRVSIRFDNECVVSRSRKLGGPTKLLVTTPESGVTMLEGAAAEQALETIMGMTAEDFDATLFFAQSDIESLISRTSGERRKIVSQWLGLEKWDAIGKEARRHAQQIAAEYEATKSVIRKPEKEPQEFDPAIAAAVQKAESSAAAHRSIEDEYVRAKAVMQDAGCVDELRRASEEVKAARERLDALPQVYAGLEADREAALSYNAGASTAAQEASATDKILRTGFDGKCPVTCTECPVRDTVSSQRDALIVKRKQMQDVQLLATQKYDEVASRVRAAESLQRNRAALESRVQTGIDSMRKIKARVDAFRAGIAESGLTAADIAELDSRRVAAIHDTAAADSAVRELRRDRQLAGEAQRRYAIELDLVATLEEQIRVANIVATATAPSGIPARIAEVQLKTLEERANALLGESGLSFEFAWERELKDLAPNCTGCGHNYKGAKPKECPKCGMPRGLKRSDELDILVSDGSGEPEDAREKSGGAKVLVACAIRLAAAMMLRDMKNSQISFALIDEPFGSLDATNREQLAKTFSAMLGSVGLEQAFVVSHDPGLLDALPARIEVFRNADASSVRLV